MGRCVGAKLVGGAIRTHTIPVPVRAAAETRDVIVLPQRVVRGWWRRQGHGLVLEDLSEVLDELPERLLVGTGAYGLVRRRSSQA